MKIKCECNSNLLSIKVFIPKNELGQENYKYFNADKDKDFRKQKSFLCSLTSPKTDFLLTKILEKLFEAYSVYYLLIEQDNQFSKDAIKTKLLFELSENIEFNEKELFSSLFELAYQFVFGVIESKTIHSQIKDRYQLNSQDILTMFIGNYGYGKTTAIKKILGFDDFYFLFVDIGRTTINNNHVRALIVRTDNNGSQYIRLYDNNNRYEDIPLSEYRFKNKITLISPKSFFEDVILLQIDKAYQKYLKLVEQPLSTQTKLNSVEIPLLDLREVVLSTFIEVDLYKLDELLGDYSNQEHEAFYDKVIEIIQKVYDNRDKQDTSSLGMICTLLESASLRESFYELYNKKVEDVMNQISTNQKNKEKENTLTSYTAGVDSETEISFELSHDSLTELDDYYINFISNNHHLRGSLLRSLVKEMYTEVDIQMDASVLSQYNTTNISSIVFSDTIGAGHMINPSGTNIDITQHFELLNECDIIFLLDDATQTMNPTTVQLLETLDNFGLSEKLILLYSKYNHFIKNDFKSDQERENYLLLKLENSLNNIFNTTDTSTYNRADILYHMFTDNQNQQLIFLKGLVKYEPPASNTTVKLATSDIIRKRANHSLKDTLPSMYENLNKDLDNPNICINELLIKVQKLCKQLNRIRFNDTNSAITLVGNTDKLLLEFYNSCLRFSEANSIHAKKEYLINIPEWNTSQALCYRLYQGYGGYSGSSRNLFPLQDALNFFMYEMNSIIETQIHFNIPSANESTIEKGTSRNKALKENTNLTTSLENTFSLEQKEHHLRNQIKARYTQKIKLLFYNYLVSANNDNWKKLYNSWGDGIKKRRASSIYNIIEFTFSTNNQIHHAAMQQFRSALEEVLEEANKR